VPAGTGPRMAEPEPPPGLSDGVGLLSASLIGTAMDLAGLAVVITDTQLEPPGPVIRYVNPHFEAVTGYSARELIGRTPRLLQGPETDRQELARLRDGLRKGGRFIGATVNYRRDGSTYLNEWVVLPVCGLDGQLTHWLSIQRDATGSPDPQPGAASLQERVARLLDGVGAVAARILSAPEDGPFGGRLEALRQARALSASPDPASGAELGTLARTLAPSVSLEGPPLVLAPGLAEPLALALHELATHAAGGATPRLHWDLVGEGAARQLRLHWSQDGVSRPGEGWWMAEGVLSFALGAEVTAETGADGLRVAIAVPMQGLGTTA